MKPHVLLTGVLVALGLTVSAVHAADPDKDATPSASSPGSSNRADPATPHPGQHQAATPATPDNPTALAHVTKNRKKEAANKARADAHADAEKQHRDAGIDHPSVERASVSKPDIVRPEIHR